MGKGLRGVAVLVIVVLFCGAASADTLTVGSSGCDYTKIQDAVDAADEGDTIVVCAGNYTENVDVGKSRLTLKGEDVVTANSSNDHAMEVTADYVNISGFTVTGATGSGKAGIYLNGADHCNIVGNNASGNRYGIYLNFSSNNTLTDNTGSLNKGESGDDSGCGIYLHFSSYNALANNTANSNSGYGGYRKRGNADDGYGYGICLNSSSHNTLTNNTANSNIGSGGRSCYNDGGNGYGYGIHLRYSSNNTLTSNNASSNIGEGGGGGPPCGGSGDDGRGYGYGIYLSSSSDNMLTKNNASSNSYGGYKKYGSGYGIYLNDSSNNILYHNNFADNIHDACDHSTNAWDNGTEGNYYSDYTGADADDDGIGDTAYLIPGDGGSVDNFPLARPWKGYRVSTEMLTVCSSGCDYTKVQDAVDDAGVGDTIFVYNGTYTENVLVDKRLKLRGEGADAVTVRAARSGHKVFEVTADRVNISGFTVTGATGSNVAGIRLYGADHCAISDNNLSKNCEGIRLFHSNNNTLVNNTMKSNRAGAYVRESSYNTLVNNTANSNSRYGIYLHYRSKYNTLTNNTANSNEEGIYLWSSVNYNTVTGNTANSNRLYGIHIEKSSSNMLTGNIANSNKVYGIRIEESSSNTLANNTANSNEYGIHISNKYSMYNTIHHNNFADNIQNDAHDTYNSANIWDDGTEGNYYSDYTGTDLDGDGIGDTLYPIMGSKGSVDNYPLMQPWKGYRVHNLNMGEDFLGIQAAIDDSDTDDGHTIIVDAGVYKMNVDMDKRLTLQGAGSGVVTIIAGRPNDHVVDVTANCVNISGFTVTGAGSGNGIYLNGTDHCSISNSNVVNNNCGIYLQNSSSNMLANNAISGNAYNFVLRGGTISEYTQSIDTSNTVDEKPIYYWVDQQDKIIPGNAGYVGVVNATNITVRDLTLTKNGEGVLFAYAEQSVIENVTVNSNKDYGIYLEDSNSNPLTGNTVNWNKCGIYMSSSSNNTLANTNASSNRDYGIYLLYSGNNMFHDNTVNWNRYGIYLHSSNDNALQNNSAANNSHGIYLHSSINNTLSGNTIHLNDQCGITLDESGNNTLTNNTADSNGDYGLYMSSSSSNRLTENTMRSNDCGIYMSSSSSNMLANNNASSNVDHGIHLCHSSNNKLVENIANRNSSDVGYNGKGCEWPVLIGSGGGDGYGYGIYLSSSINNTLTKNTANSNGGRGGSGGGGSLCYYGGDGGSGYGYGIYLRSSSNNTLTGNIANLNCGRGGAGGSGGGRIGGSTSGGGGGDGDDGYGYGIYLRSSSNNTLTGNIANSNSGDGGRGGRALDIDAVAGSPGGDYGYGVHLSSSSSNTLYHNNLANNTPYNAYDDSYTNTWDSGSEGNYYSDYNGADNNTDGIGDDPHPIPGGGGSVDRFPLMQPWTATLQKGDLNGDSILTLADAVIALHLAAGGSASCDAAMLAVADVDGDGMVTSLDALTILQASAGNIELEGCES